VTPVLSVTHTCAAVAPEVDQLKVNVQVPPGVVTVQGLGLALIVPVWATGAGTDTFTEDSDAPRLPLE
jgi:hypothetical protein